MIRKGENIYVGHVKVDIYLTQRYIRISKQNTMVFRLRELFVVRITIIKSEGDLKAYIIIIIIDS